MDKLQFLVLITYNSDQLDLFCISNGRVVTFIHVWRKSGLELLPVIFRILCTKNIEIGLFFYKKTMEGWRFLKRKLE